MAVDFEAVTQLCRQYADDVRRAMPVDRAALYGQGHLVTARLLTACLDASDPARAARGMA